MKIGLDTRYARGFMEEGEVGAIWSEAEAAFAKLPGLPMTGWVDLPESAGSRAEVSAVLTAAQQIRASAEVLVVIGIGGSYLGARAAISALPGDFPVIFAGTDLSSTMLYKVLEEVADKDFAVNVISKSGTTLEPSLAFRVFRQKLTEKYGVEEANKRIFATTGAAGTLHDLAERNGWATFEMPETVGGRYSVLTAVGLLPIAAAGIDIRDLMAGAAEARAEYLGAGAVRENPVCGYAILRNLALRQGKKIEILASYESRLEYFAEWWKQLYGESEGKQGKGLFPASVTYTTDLHSLGQYVQEGPRELIETVLRVSRSPREFVIAAGADNADGLNYLAGKTLDWVASQALEATAGAHSKGGVPNIILDIPEINAHSIGHLFYFFELSCAISALILGVNPFDQPGVEAYKARMFELLGKK